MSFQIVVECRRGRHKCHPTIVGDVPVRGNIRHVYKILEKLDPAAPGSFRCLWQRIRSKLEEKRLYLVTITYTPADGGKKAKLKSISLTFRVPKDLHYHPRKREFDRLRIAKVSEWEGSDGRKRITIKIVPRRR